VKNLDLFFNNLDVILILDLLISFNVGGILTFNNKSLYVNI